MLMKHLTQMEAVDQFQQFMLDNGISPPSSIEADGQIHRYHIEGQKSGSKNGAYAFYYNGHGFYGGFVRDWTLGEQTFSWSSHSKSDFLQLSPKQRESIKKEQQRQREKSAQEMKNQYQHGINNAVWVWEQAQAQACHSHSYLENKHLLPIGLRVLDNPITIKTYSEGEKTYNEGSLIIPINDRARRLMSLQLIDRSYPGSEQSFFKQNLKDTSVKGGRLELRTDTDPELIDISEGYATGLSVQLASKQWVVVAFSLNNMEVLAEEYQKSYPDAVIRLACDNDQFKKTNAGIKTGQAVSQKLGIPYTYPEFLAQDWGKKPNDFNDSHSLYGLEEVKKQLAGNQSTVEPTQSQELIPKRPKTEVIEGQNIEYFLNGNGDRHYRATTEEQNGILFRKILRDYNQQYHFTLCGKDMRIVLFKRESVGIDQERKEWQTTAKISKDGFLDARKNDNFTIINAEGKKEKQNKARCWLNNDDLTIYRGGIVFKPHQYCQKEELNLWRNLNVRAKKGDWSLIQQHFLNVICNNHQEHYEYLLDWVAHLYQKPFEKLGVAIVLRSPERGTGKGSFVELISKPIMDYYLPLNSAKQLTGRFNAHMDGKLLLFADEAVWGGDEKAKGALYTLISETLMPSEAKFQDITLMANYSRVIMATNNDWVVPVGNQERRFFFLNVLASLAGNQNYFKRLRQQAFEQGGIEAMLYDLLKRPIDSNSLRKPPVTEGLKEQYEQGKGNIEEYLTFCLDGNYLYYANPEQTLDYSPIWQDLEQEVRKDFFYFGFCQYCKQTGKKSKLPNQTIFGRKINQLIPSIKDSKITAKEGRVNTYILPPNRDAKKLLSEQTGLHLFE